jgi:hypothetical protein
MTKKKVKPARPGLPSPDSVRRVINKVAPTGRRFRILRTVEADSYDEPPAATKRRKRGRP